LLRDKRLIESELLVVRWLRGDEEAFGAIVGLWERSLFYYVRRLIGSEADAWEVMQEAWLKVLRAGKSLRDPGAFPAFLYRIARNAAVSRLRQKGLRLEAPEAVEGDAGEVAADWVDEFDDADEVHTALDRLAVTHREVLTLFFLRELSLEEIAELLEIPVGTVKSRLHHARRAMRDCLENLKGDCHVGRKQ
jgi:RNA polymerase sigma-70 factor (ECF subfamily)